MPNRSLKHQILLKNIPYKQKDKSRAINAYQNSSNNDEKYCTTSYKKIALTIIFAVENSWLLSDSFSLSSWVFSSSSLFRWFRRWMRTDALSPYYKKDKGNLIWMFVEKVTLWVYPDFLPKTLRKSNSSADVNMLNQ